LTSSLHRATIAIVTAPGAQVRFKRIDLKRRLDSRPGFIPSTASSCRCVREIHWPTRGVRIGETGRSIRAKIGHDLHWFRSMRDGTAAAAQLGRNLPIALAARKSGAEGFEFYVVSSDPRLLDKALRQDVERFMFAWVRRQPTYVDWTARSAGTRRGDSLDNPAMPLVLSSVPRLASSVGAVQRRPA